MSIALSAFRPKNKSAHLPSQLLTRLETKPFPSWRLVRPVPRGLGTATSSDNEVPYRKQLKEESKRRRAAKHLSNEETEGKDARSEKWELTVGIEVHAQLNTERKLFSRARTSIDAEPNSHVAVFDLAYPGTQPNFQKATLIPALRAAIAFNCTIQRRSRFDRKHYFYPDQPAGYQITQYYEPYAKDGSIVLYDHDGIAPEDGHSVTIGIKQIQMEQDTAKTIQQDSVTLLDFNRVSHPLIEIITLPQIHSPQTAAACVRKIQATLQAVNAVTTGMEMGGLRADVNVSVRLRDRSGEQAASFSYSGVTGLGQRTEIKNLSSFKAVEDAIIAERDRQIEVLESGGMIEAETRGWALGNTATTRLRGKEGEVDYRYMPDPDLAPIIISEDLITHISETLPELPDTSIKELVDEFKLTLKDAKTLISVDDGKRLAYFDQVLAGLVKTLQSGECPDLPEQYLRDPSITKADKTEYARLVANWAIHEVGSVTASSDSAYATALERPVVLVHVLQYLVKKQITGQSAKKLFLLALENPGRHVDQIFKEENLELKEIPRAEYLRMAQSLIDANQETAEKVRKGHQGKLMWFVGQMVRGGKGSIEAPRAKEVLEELLAVGSS
ncbi:MAG: hypothetical protein Q9195_008263 [Heterodermia aff. obscurata]